MIDYLLKFPSKDVAEQFGLANGFASEVDGVISYALASHTYALCDIGEHNGLDYWVLFRDLVGIPIPSGGDEFIFWSSNMTTIDDADGSEILLPRPEFNPNVPNTFWS